MAAINADPDVMQHFVAPLTREQTARTIAGYEASFAVGGHRFPRVGRLVPEVGQPKRGSARPGPRLG